MKSPWFIWSSDNIAVCYSTSEADKKISDIMERVLARTTAVLGDIGVHLPFPFHMEKSILDVRFEHNALKPVIFHSSCSQTVRFVLQEVCQCCIKMRKATNRWKVNFLFFCYLVQLFSGIVVSVYQKEPMCCSYVVFQESISSPLCLRLMITQLLVCSKCSSTRSCLVCVKLRLQTCARGHTKLCNVHHTFR